MSEEEAVGKTRAFHNINKSLGCNSFQHKGFDICENCDCCWRSLASVSLLIN